jgi:hypothetical protein
MGKDRKQLRRLLAAALSLLLLAGLVPASTASALGTAADGTVDRLQVPAGGTVTVQVSGFETYEPLSSWVSSVRGTVYSTAEVDTDVNGNATLQIQTGRFWEPGWWAVTVNGQYSDIRTIVRFEITAAIPDGRLDIEPDTASPGSTVRFHGAGFTDGEPISVWATRPDGGVNTFTPDLYSTNGEVSFAYELPDNAAPGDWSMTAYGLVSGRLLIVPFIVTEQ